MMGRWELEEADVVCVTCGHPAWLHTKPEGQPGDCLHRSRSSETVEGVYRYDCACEEFKPACYT